MPRTLTSVSPISDAINRRFFVAVEYLISTGKINSLSHFCELHDLSSPRYREMRLGYGVAPKPGYKTRYKNLEIESIYALIANYPISSYWLFTGREKMIANKK